MRYIPNTTGDESAHPVIGLNKSRYNKGKEWIRNDEIIDINRYHISYKGNPETRPHIRVTHRKLRSTMTILALSILLPPSPLRFHQDDDAEPRTSHGDAWFLEGSRVKQDEDICTSETRTYANCRGGASQGLAQLTLRFVGATNLRNGPVV